MTYLLDSNVVILHLGGDPATRQLVNTVVVSGIAISLISYMEVYQGIYASADPVVAQIEFESWLSGGVPVLPFDQVIALRCARLRADLNKQGRRVRSRALDLVIAATALEHGLTLVTANKADYRDIPNLSLY